MAPRETENNAHAKFWGDKQRALWYVMVFSGVINFELAATCVQTSLVPALPLSCRRVTSTWYSVLGMKVKASKNCIDVYCKTIH